MFHFPGLGSNILYTVRHGKEQRRFLKIKLKQRKGDGRAVHYSWRGIDRGRRRTLPSVSKQEHACVWRIDLCLFLDSFSHERKGRKGWDNRSHGAKLMSSHLNYEPLFGEILHRHSEGPDPRVPEHDG